MTKTKTKPSLPRRVLNAGKAVVRNTHSVLKGNDLLIPKEEIEKRLAICREDMCDCYIEEEDICTECGCYLELKVKLLAEYCPQHRWLGDLQQKLGEKHD